MYKNGQKHNINCGFTYKDWKKIHVFTYKREYIKILNPCNFLLMKIEEMRSCIFCINAAYTWVRL